MLDTFRGVSRVATWIAGAALVVCSVAIAIEVVLRKAFSISLGGVDEITGYAFAIGVAWSLAYTLLARAHIRIDIVYMALPRRLRSLLDLLALASLVLVVGLLVWQAGATALTSWELKARSNTPLGTFLWIPQLLWVAGLGFFLTTVAALASVAILRLARGDDRGVSEIVGIRTLEEEIRDET